MLASKYGQHKETPLLQYVLTPIYNFLRDLSGLNQLPLPPLDVYLSNDELLDISTIETTLGDYENQVLLTLMRSFVFRDMEKARATTTLSKAIPRKGMLFYYVLIDFYAGLTYCFFLPVKVNAMTRRGMCKIYAISSKTCVKIRNGTENKQYHLGAECHFAKGEIRQAADAYNASIKAAKDRKFIHEMALSCELAGYFYKEQGDEDRSKSMFMQAREAYIEWGANGKALLIPR